MADYSITRALNELTLLDKRINDGIAQARFASYQTGKNLIDGQVSAEVFADRAKKSLQSIRDLIARRNEVKSKIIASNSVTEVTIARKVMKVAEAIDRKASIVHEKTLLSILRNQYVQSTNKALSENILVKNRLDKNIEIMLGKDVKDKAAEVEAMTKSFNELNAVTLVDPLGIKDLIDELQKNIEDFENEVDFILSESNVRNSITLAD